LAKLLDDDDDQNSWVKSYKSNKLTYYYLPENRRPDYGAGHGRANRSTQRLGGFRQPRRAMTAALAVLPKPAKAKAGTLLALIGEYRGRSGSLAGPGRTHRQSG